MTADIPTRKQYNNICKDLKILRKEYKQVVIRANKAEKNVERLKKCADDYLKIYKTMEIELTWFRRGHPQPYPNKLENSVCV